MEARDEEGSGRWPWVVGALVVLVIVGAGLIVFTSSSFKKPPAAAPSVAAPK